jgi:hypothetical protein
MNVSGENIFPDTIRAKELADILANPDSLDVPRLEAEINKLVYAFYGLIPEEIAIVEGKR